MPFDQAPQVETAPGPNWELPEITNVKIQSAAFTPTSLRNFEHPLAAVDNAVEIVVSLKGPMPIRAMAPVLWVGGQRLTESEVVDKGGKKMRFWALDPPKLEEGAPISMAWMNEPPASVVATARGIAPNQAKFTYKRPK